MEIPNYQPFYIDSLGALREEIARLGLELPIDEDSATLAGPVAIGSRDVANRFCIQPMAGGDAQANGAPGELTRRRYRRYANGGAGLIWIESTIAGSPDGSPTQLALHEDSVDSFRSMVEELREAAHERWQRDIVLILQLTAATPKDAVAHRLHDESPKLLTDATIDTLKNALIGAGELAAAAGFDGIDVQACRGALAGTLLGAFTREGDYGGSFANRTRFLRETLDGIRSRAPELVLATRLCAYDALRAPFGFGVDATDYRKFDLEEPRLLVCQLHESGLELLNSTVATPNLSAPLPERAFQPRSDSEPPDEHPLMVLDRQLHVAGALREAAPGLKVVGSGFSWLRRFVPEIAAGAIGGGSIDFVGLGRSALAYPGAPAAIIENGAMEPGSSCMVCFACDDLLADGAKVGCPIRDREIYGSEYRGARQFDANRLGEEAERCHLCESAPCIAASPSGIDIPAFIRAYRDGDERGAYQIIRKSDVLPEMTSQLTPGWLYSEAACIETALTGRPIPILDLQYAISWRARNRGETGVSLPDLRTGKKIAVVGGGPAGIAATSRLLEHGHEVDLFESSELLGGTPERVIPSSRFHGATAEVEAILDPGVQSGRLRIHTKTGLGAELELESLRKGWDAVILATGLWQEQSLGNDEVEGAVDALAFLESVKRDTTTGVPKRVAVLAGGDSAMDAANTAVELGAEDVFVVFGGPRSAMHWHLPEAWFGTPGVHAMMRCRPVGFELDGSGALEGLRIHQAEFDQQSVLRVDLVIRAMGLQSADLLRMALDGLALTEGGRLLQIDDGFRTSADGVFAAGALVNGGASVSQCVSEGLAAAERIHDELGSQE